MRTSETLTGLRRRWYILVPGVILAAGAVAGSMYLIPPGYERSATQLLVPGEDSLPEGGNPYLFLGGLAPAADVLVRAIGSENVLNEIAEEYPGVEAEVARDTTTAGPIITIVVTARTDAAAEEVVNLLVDRTATVLDELQDAEDIAGDNRVTVQPITIDSQSVLQQRSRIIAAAAAGVGVLLVTLLLAGLVEGLSGQRRRRVAAAMDHATSDRATSDRAAPGHLETGHAAVPSEHPDAVPAPKAAIPAEPSEAGSGSVQKRGPRDPRAVPRRAGRLSGPSAPPLLFDQSAYSDHENAAPSIEGSR